MRSARPQLASANGIFLASNRHYVFALRHKYVHILTLLRFSALPGFVTCVSKCVILCEFTLWLHSCCGCHSPVHFAVSSDRVVHHGWRVTSNSPLGHCPGVTQLIPGANDIQFIDAHTHDHAYGRHKINKPCCKGASAATSPSAASKRMPQLRRCKKQQQPLSTQRRMGGDLASPSFSV